MKQSKSRPCMNPIKDSTTGSIQPSRHGGGRQRRAPSQPMALRTGGFVQMCSTGKLELYNFCTRDGGKGICGGESELAASRFRT
eukprot:1432973-Rhodomonas_salina.2